MHASTLFLIVIFVFLVYSDAVVPLDTIRVHERYAPVRLESWIAGFEMSTVDLHPDAWSYIRMEILPLVFGEMMHLRL